MNVRPMRIVTLMYLESVMQEVPSTLNAFTAARMQTATNVSLVSDLQRHLGKNLFSGCKYDGPSDSVPSCPSAPQPICNEDTHRCEAAPGHQLLTYIKVNSNGCDGCTEEGLSMKLVGDDEVVPVPECETVGLDHPNKVDFASVGEFRAVEEERPLGWGSCYEVKNN